MKFKLFFICLVLVFILLACQKNPKNATSTNFLGWKKSEVRQKFGIPGEVMDDAVYADIYNDLGIYFFYDGLESNSQVIQYCAFTGVLTNKEEIVQYNGDVFGYRLGDNKNKLKKLRVKLTEPISIGTLVQSDLFFLDGLEAQFDNHRIAFGLFEKEVVVGGKKFEAGTIGFITVQKYKKNTVLIGGGGGGPDISYENLIMISKQLKKGLEFEEFKKIWKTHCKNCEPHFISVDRDHAYISNDDRLEIKVKYKQDQGKPIKIKSFQIFKK